MSQLQSLMENRIDYEQLNEDIDIFGEMLKEAMDDISTMMDKNYGTEDDWAGVTSDLNSAMKMFQAAQRGLGIVNKLQPGEYRAQHAKRVMGNMNRLRALVQRITRRMDELLAAGA